ncbi:hypothetical protein DL93DRAFT_2090820 [Clavulina sp. PMI_390]|nr:hypothetical protein DL93DRAFT_2090820 [Clavulina sp. PMI_390]
MARTVLDRAQLRAKAKQLGVRANQSNERMVEEIGKALNEQQVFVGSTEVMESEDDTEVEVVARPTRTRGAANRAPSNAPGHSQTRTTTRTTSRSRAILSEEPVSHPSTRRVATRQAQGASVPSVPATTTTASKSSTSTTRSTRNKNAVHKIEVAAPESDSSSNDEDEEDNDDDEPVIVEARRGRPPKARPQNGATTRRVKEQVSYKEETSDIVTTAKPTPTKPKKPKSLTSDSDDALLQAANSAEPSTSSALMLVSLPSLPKTPRPSQAPTFSSPRVNGISSSLDPRLSAAQISQSEDYATLRADLMNSQSAITSLQAALDAERAKTAILETQIVTGRGRATQLGEDIEKERRTRIDENKTFNDRLFSVEQSNLQLKKYDELSETFKTFQRETTGVIDSYKANVAALDKYTRALEERLKKLETAATTSTNGSASGRGKGGGARSKPVFAVGTPPAPRTGKRTQRDNEGRSASASSGSAGGDGDEGNDGPEVDESPSLQPSPAKRPRVEDSMATFAETSFGTDPGLSQFVGGSRIGDEDVHLDNVPATGTIDPSALTTTSAANVSPSLSRPIVPLRRSTASKESSTPKLVRTSALSFGQALRPGSTSMTTGGLLFGGGAPFEFGSPNNASTPAIMRSAQLHLPPADQSLDSSFAAAGFQFRPGFSFNAGDDDHSFVPPLSRPDFDGSDTTSAMIGDDEDDDLAISAMKSVRGGPPNAGPSGITGDDVDGLLEFAQIAASHPHHAMTTAPSKSPQKRKNNSNDYEPAFPVPTQTRRYADDEFGYSMPARSMERTDENDTSVSSSPPATRYGTEVGPEMARAYANERWEGEVVMPFASDLPVQARAAAASPSKQRAKGFGLGPPDLTMSSDGERTREEDDEAYNALPIEEQMALPAGPMKAYDAALFGVPGEELAGAVAAMRDTSAAGPASGEAVRAASTVTGASTSAAAAMSTTTATVGGSTGPAGRAAPPRLDNPSPTRYGMDNPMTWGAKPPRGRGPF